MPRTPQRPEGSATPDPFAAPELRLRLPADWLAPSLIRRRLRRWLEAHQWPADALDDVLLVVSEAVSNSVEHGYRVPRDSVGHPGVVRIGGEIVPDGRVRRVRVTVRDHGGWRPTPADPGHRRLGIPLMHALMDSLGIDGAATGTTVVLLSRPMAD